MNHEEFDQFVQQIEAGVGRNHEALRRRVLQWALLGYAGLLMPLALVVTVSLAFIIPGIIWISEAFPFLLIGVCFLVVGCWAVANLLWIRLAAPEGRTVTRAEAPALFALIDETRQRLRAAKFYRVLIVPDCNAAVSYSPRLGVFGWNRNYLMLGLPLMEGLSRDEFAFVLAHECAHLSRQHHRSGQWVYRLRRSWEQVFAHLSQLHHSGVISLRPFVQKFINWFWPRFNAHAFVLSRAHEYQADATAAQLVGVPTAATALIRNDWHGRVLDEKFWPDLWQQVADHPAAPEGVFLRLTQLLNSLGVGEIQRLEQGFRFSTTNSNTHPCLSERLRGIGRNLDAQSADRETVLLPPQPNSAEVLLGPALPAIRADIEKLWRKKTETNWSQQHRKASVLQERLGRLDQSPVVRQEDVDAMWDKAQALLQLRTPEAATPLLRQILALAPKNVNANFHLGSFLLQSGDGEGEQYLEQAIAGNEELFPRTVDCFQAYYQRTGQSGRIRELYARLDKYEKTIAASRLERSDVTAADKLLPHELSDAELATLCAVLAADPDVMTADLGRKELRYFVEQKLYLLCIRIRPEWYLLTNTDRQQAAINRLIQAVRLPGRVFIFAPSGAFRPIARKLTRIPNARIFSKR